jgi:hypothetical protein
VTCAARDTLNARIWWLADPLWTQVANERLVEQEVRRVDIALRQATHQDERYSFDEERGGDAVATIIERYGWPSYTAWGWREEDYNRDRYLIRSHSPPTPPYTSFEYALGRVSTIPTWRAITAPFDAVSHDWRLVVEDSLGNHSEEWWPEEHFNPSRRLVQLPDGQSVSIRRQHHIEIATALELSHPAMRTARTSFDVVLVSSSGPHRVDSIAQHSARGGAAVFLRGVVGNEPVLLGIEALGRDTSAIHGRTRFAYKPPATLSAMRPRDIALSEIGLLSTLPDRALRTPHDSLLRALLPTRTVPLNARNVVLYWENYGILPTDSATVVVRVTPQANIGVARRIGMAAGVASDPNTAVEIRWRDHEARGGTTTLRGPVPVQMRTLSLDLQSLKPGRYVIQVAMLLKDRRSAERQVMMELLP